MDSLEGAFDEEWYTCPDPEMRGGQVSDFYRPSIYPVSFSAVVFAVAPLTVRIPGITWADFHDCRTVQRSFLYDFSPAVPCRARKLPFEKLLLMSFEFG